MRLDAEKQPELVNWNAFNAATGALINDCIRWADDETHEVGVVFMRHGKLVERTVKVQHVRVMEGIQAIFITLFNRQELKKS